MYGLRNADGTHFLKKGWTILTTDQVMKEKLERRCPDEHLHARIHGKETARSAYYPPAMASVVVAVWSQSLGM